MDINIKNTIVITLPYVGVLTVENPGTQPVTIKVTFTRP